MKKNARNILKTLCGCMFLAFASAITLQAAEYEEYGFDENIKFETLQLEDFGFEGKLTIGDNDELTTIKKTAGEGSLHGVAIEGVYNLSVGLDYNLLMFGGEGCGLWVIPQEDGLIRFVLVVEEEDHRYPIDCGNYWAIRNSDLYRSGIDINLTGDDFKMKLAFVFANPDKKISDLKVIVTINDTYEDFFIMEDIPVSSLGKTVFAWTKFPMTFKTIEYANREAEELAKEQAALQEENEPSKNIDWNKMGLYMAVCGIGIPVVCGIVSLIQNRRKEEK